MQAHSILPRLAALPEIGRRENLAVFAWFGLQGALLEMDGVRMYPHGGGEYGNDLIGRHAKHFGADVVVTVVDAWTQHDTAAKVYPARWVSWCPVDSDPVPAMTVDALQGAIPLVYSKWGRDQLAKAGIAARYVPLGIDTAVFKPEPDAGRRLELRRQLVGPGCEHLTVMVAANISGGEGGADRKAFAQQMRGWALFAADKPGARLYIHADPLPHYGGLDLRALAAALGIGERVTFADSYQYFLGYPAAYVAAVYQAADVYLGASMAEGFGLPIVEAQACFPGNTYIEAEGVVRGSVRPYTGDLITIETDAGSFDVTPEHPIWCSNGWHFASQIDAGCQLLYNSEYAKQGIQEVHRGRIADVVESVRADAAEGSGAADGRELWRATMAVASDGHNQAHWSGERVASLGFGANGIGLLGGIDRWRGDCIDSQIPRQMEADSANCEYVNGSDCLAGIKDHVTVCGGGNKTGETQPFDQLYVQYHRPGSSPPIRISPSVHGDQAPTITVGHRVLLSPQSAKQRRPSYPAPDGGHFRSSSAQYQTVKSVERRYVTDLPVYNLSTKSGVYYAAGFLVHNCGIPVVVTDFSSMPEPVRWGWTVPPKDKWWAAGYAAWWAWPDAEGIAEALQKLYEDGPPDDIMAEHTSRAIHAEFGWDAVVRDYWAPLVREWV